MVSYIFDDILSKPNRPQRARDARNFFRDAAEQITRGRANPERVIRGNRDSLTSRMLPGRMYMFQYDPKLKKKLPYYDTFPLIFPIEPPRGESFLALNLHYLPPPLRARLMDELYNRTINLNDMDLNTRVRVSYDILKSASNLRFYRPCIKRYLFSNIRSRFLYIDPDRWDIALMLPTARFQKASINRVYLDSRRMVRRRS